jgi:hypothetical protein
MAALLVTRPRVTMEGMAKRGRPPKPPESTAKGGERTKDRHASGFMIRLPDVYRDLLRKIGDPDLTFTVKVRRAVDGYLKTNGVEPPKPESL